MCQNICSIFIYQRYLLECMLSIYKDNLNIINFSPDSKLGHIDYLNISHTQLNHPSLHRPHSSIHILVCKYLHLKYNHLCMLCTLYYFNNYLHQLHNLQTSVSQIYNNKMLLYWSSRNLYKEGFNWHILHKYQDRPCNYHQQITHNIHLYTECTRGQWDN